MSWKNQARSMKTQGVMYLPSKHLATWNVDVLISSKTVALFFIWIVEVFPSSLVQLHGGPRNFVEYPRRDPKFYFFSQKEWGCLLRHTKWNQVIHLDLTNQKELRYHHGIILISFWIYIFSAERYCFRILEGNKMKTGLLLEDAQKLLFVS
jgi:hypothetical protein